MKSSVVASRLIRWPGAQAVESKTGWLVVRGDDQFGEEVLPIGVSRSLKFANEPSPLAVTLRQIHESLRDVAVLEGGEAAEALADFCRLYPVPDLCRHGLGRFHRRDDTGAGPSCSLRRWESGPALSVNQVQAFVSGLLGVSSLARHLVDQRRPPSPAVVKNALQWPVMNEKIRALALSDVERGEFPVARARQIVTSTLSSGFAQSGLVTDFEWSPNSRPQMVFRASTNLAAYMADFARHVTAKAGELEDRSVVCENCGLPFVPKRQPVGAVFCTQPECRKERNRRHVAAHRERKKAQTDG